MIFWVLASALVILALAFVLLPWWWFQRHNVAEGPSEDKLNVDLLREAMAELEAQRERGALGEPAYLERREELDARLLEEVNTPAPRREDSGHGWLVPTLALVLPLAALVMYQQLGAGQAWQLSERYHAMAPQLADGSADAAQLMAFAGDLAQHTQGDANPDWLFLQAQLAMQMGLYQVAADNYQRVAALQPGSADLLARRAQALYLARGRVLDGEVQAAIDAVLAINPHQPTVLGMQGMHAYESGNFALAIESWQTALRGMPPMAPDRAILQQGIEQARSAMGISESDPSREAAATGFDAGLRVRVSLAENVAASADSTVYILASAPGGGMPFAVVRLPLSALPTEVTLDDSTAMAPGNSLGRQQAVRVTARVSLSGNAIAQKGDWQGQSEVLQAARAPELVNIIIDQAL